MAESSRFRRSPSAVENEAVATALEMGISAAMIKNCSSGQNFISYKSLDFKRGVDHEGISKHESLLHNLLNINPTGIYNQKQIYNCLVKVLVEVGLQSNCEVDAYKIRVMLSHLRLMAQRNLPPHLPEHVAASCCRLIALMETGSAGSKAPTHNTNPNHYIT